jgi:ribonuclease-3 family protein
MIQHNGLALAYLGDAVYELKIRAYLLERGMATVDTLHQEAVSYTNAEAQAEAYSLIEAMLSDEEVDIFKRGRNAKSDRKTKAASIAAYRRATGLEAIFGYLYLMGKTDRIDELLARIVHNS